MSSSADAKAIALLPAQPPLGRPTHHALKGRRKLGSPALPQHKARLPNQMSGARHFRADDCRIEDANPGSDPQMAMVHGIKTREGKR